MQPSSVVSTYDYQYNQAAINRLRQKIKYPLVAGSELDSVVKITYLDGLGREVESIHKYGAPQALTDVIMRTVYDSLGRVVRKHNPEAIASNHGAYVAGTTTEPHLAATYYHDMLARPHTQTPPQWYAQTLEYGSNTTTLTSPDGVVYAINSLSKHTQKDEDNKQSIVYTDKVGRKVCEIKADATQTSTAATWYIYDDKDRIMKVVPPGATLANTGLLFEYQYDAADNLIYKKVPDAAAEQYVYNARDLLIGMRNGVLQAQSKWLVTHYDDYGRPTKRGYHNLAATLPSTDNPTIHTLLEEYFYDGYNGSTTNTAAINKGKLKKRRVKALDDIAVNTTWIETEYFYDSYGRVTTTSGTNHRGQTETTMMTYDFADNILTSIHNISGPTGVNHVMKHIYDKQGRMIYDIININSTGEKTLAESVYNHRNEIVEKNLGRFATSGTMQYLQSIDYSYNAQGWLTKINELFAGTLPMGPDPCTGGSASRPEEESAVATATDDFDLFALKLDYDFNIGGTYPNYKNGNISKQTWWHKGQYNQHYGYKYDYLDRVVDAKHNDVLNQPEAPERYTEKFGYDIRGNITSLSRKGVTHRQDLNEDCYAVSTIDSLQYNYAAGSNKLNTVVDKAPCLDVIYLPAQIDRDVSYAANQLIIVDKTKVSCLADVNLRVGVRLEVRDTFRITQSCAAPPTVYVDQGPCPDVKHTAGFSQQSTAPYVYDASGNTTYDPHKKLTIQYNYLNLPYKVIGNEQDTLYNLYAADGYLLQRKYNKQGITLMKVDFIANKEWHKDTLRIIHHNDGRVIKKNNVYEYEYNIKDHLGNNRVTFSDSNNDNIVTTAERRSKNDYYSFGMEHFDPHQGSEYKNPENRYLYNGKEMIGEMDYNVLDFGQRLADPALGRFATLDRFSAKFEFQSGYAVAANNPIKYIDVNGDSIKIGNVVWLPGATYEGEDEFTSAVFKALNSLYSNIKEKNVGNVKTNEAQGNIILDFAYSKDIHIQIAKTTESSNSDASNTINWNPLEGLEITKAPKSIKEAKNGANDVAGTISAVTTLAHEFAHKWLLKFSPNLYYKLKYDRLSVDADEIYFVLPIERQFAVARGETGLRFSYNATGWPDEIKDKNIINLNGNKHTTKIDFKILKPW